MPATAADLSLTRRYQTRLGRLAAAAGTTLANLWEDMDDRSQQAWLNAAAPVVAAGQDQAAALAAGFVAALAGVPTPAVDARSGPDIADPFIAFGSALKRGKSFTTAVELGASRADAIGSGSVQWTARAAVGQAAADTGTVGYRRVLTGVSCEWCATVAAQRYRTAESASFGHTRCDCTVVPIIGDRDPGQTINRPVLDRLNETPGDGRTGYVEPSGAPAPRPQAVEQVPRQEP